MSTRRYAEDLETEVLALAEEYHDLGLSADEVVAAVRVAMTAFVRILEEKRN